MKKYNEYWQSRIASFKGLSDSPEKFERVTLAETQIDVSGKLVDVTIERSVNGHISINVDDMDLFSPGGWLEMGACTEGYHIIDDIGSEGIECQLTAFTI